MSKLIDEIRKEALSKKEPVDKAAFNKAKEELSEEEFNDLYYMDDGSYCYRRRYNDIKENEIDTYLLYASLKEQRNMRASLSLITGILVIYSILTIIGAIIVYIQLF